MKQHKTPWGFIILLTVLGGFYIHGARIADLSEMPSSQRPWKVWVSAGV